MIHATPLAVAPIKEAFERLWPQARRMNVLDDSLPSDLVATGCVDDALVARFIALVRYARQSGAQGVLFTCSAFGTAIEAAGAANGVRALKPNEAMFDEALDICATLGRPGRVGLISTFAASVNGMAHELETMARARGLEVSLQVAVAQGALDALGRGDSEEHDSLISDAARLLLACDVLMLGQFSMSHMQDRIASETSLPVLNSPDSAVRLLKRTVATIPTASLPSTDWR